MFKCMIVQRVEQRTDGKKGRARIPKYVSAGKRLETGSEVISVLLPYHGVLYTICLDCSLSCIDSNLAIVLRTESTGQPLVIACNSIPSGISVQASLHSIIYSSVWKYSEGRKRPSSVRFSLKSKDD